MMNIQAALERKLELAASKGQFAAIVVVPVPDNLARFFPEGKYPAHITVNYIMDGDKVDASLMNSIVHIVRDTCKKVPWFRCALDVNRGLHDFGPGDDGYKALWFGVRDDPQGSLAYLHQAVKLGLAKEGVKTDDFTSYVPHATWDYVPNSLSLEEKYAVGAFASKRLSETSPWWDVYSVAVGCTDGSYKTATLSPLRK
jgi:hypothetical protein